MSRAPKASAHPSPHRDPRAVPLLLGALAAGPAGWVLQLEVGYGLSSFACFPHNVALTQTPPPGWAHEPALLLALNLFGLALCAGGLAVALLYWRRTSAKKLTATHDRPDVAEARTRFLAACGVLTSLGFALATLFDTVSILATPTCWSIPS